MPVPVTLYSEDIELLREIGRNLVNSDCKIGTLKEVDSPHSLNLADWAVVIGNVWEIFLVLGGIKGSVDAILHVWMKFRSKREKAIPKLEIVGPNSARLTLDISKDQGQLEEEIKIFLGNLRSKRVNERS